MTDWTRNDSILLGETAMQCGLTPVEADAALMLGARMRAYGFSAYEIDEMISWQLRQWWTEEKKRND